MSVAPGDLVPTLEASGPRGAPFSRGPAAAAPGAPRVTEVARLRLQPGDRLILQVDGQHGMGPGGGGDLIRQVAEALKLDELGFDVPIAVLAPGFRLMVVHP